MFCVVVFSELYEHHYNSNTGKVLFTAAKMLCQMLEADVPMVIPDDMDLPAIIHNLACQAITVCHSGKINTWSTMPKQHWILNSPIKTEYCSF